MYEPEPVFQQANSLLGNRNHDKKAEDVLINIQGDIAIYANSENADSDLVDVLEGIRELLTRLVNKHPRIDVKERC